MQLRDLVRRRGIRALAGAVIALTSFTPVQTQTVPVDREALESGAGAGMAAYADPNGYPGPKHVLELQDTLNLTDDQLKQVEAIFDEMSENARSLGAQIIDLEEQLHALFTAKKAEEGDVRDRSSEIGRLRGELRAVHLAAHIQASRILTRQQTDLYTELRRSYWSSHRHGAQ